MAVQSVAVRFHGDRAAEGPMTLGQRNVYKWLFSLPADSEAPAYGMQFLPLRPGPDVTVADIAETMAVLLARHEGLRTYYLDGGRQHVIDSGELLLHIVAVDENAEPSAVDRALDATLEAQPYDPGTQLPVCVVLATRAEQVLAGILRCSHMAADHRSMVALDEQLKAMLADRAARVVGPPGHQPLDRAQAEQTPAVRRRTEGALDYWRQRIQRMPANPLASRQRHGEAESCALEMASYQAAAAVRRIEERTSLDPSTTVLSAVLAVLAARSGYPTHTFCAMSSNRFFDRRLADYVGTLAASSLADIDCSGASFDELGRRVRAGMLPASLNALYDVYRLHAIAAQVEHARGIALHGFPPIFNNAALYYHARSPTPSTTAAPTEFTWRSMPPTPAPLRFDLWRADDVLALEVWTADTSRINRKDASAMLLAVERLLGAAAETDLDADRIRAIVDLPVIPRGEGWLFLDSCWIHEPEVQRLLDAALPLSRIFSTVGGRSLVAYVVATDAVRTPAEAHMRSMAQVSRYPAAMTPRHYVLCERAPDDPDDLSAWQGQPVLAEGSGREFHTEPALAAVAG